MKAHFETLESLRITSENELEAHVLDEFVYQRSLTITNSSHYGGTSAVTLKRCDERKVSVIKEILVQLHKRDKEKDDTLSLYDWSRLILIKTIFHLRPESAREELLEIAALAFAAIVSIDHRPRTGGFEK